MALRAPLAVQGIALSPDGIMLAASFRYQVPLSADPLHYGGIEVIDLVTGTTGPVQHIRDGHPHPGPSRCFHGGRP